MPASDADLSARARRVLKQRLELERALGADVLPRKRHVPVPSSVSPQPPARAEARDDDGAGRLEGWKRGPTGAAQPPLPAEKSLRSSTLPVFHPTRTSAPRDPVLDLPEETRIRFVALRDEALACTKCGLCKSRTQVVFGVGTPRTPLLFVGEAPGADEDRLGEPFVGRAGQLLTRALSDLKVRRDEVYIANILKCRPPDNRKPEPEEIAQCFPYLRRQIDLIRPRVLCALGAVAASALLGAAEPITRIRGRFYDFPWVPGLRVFPTFHPAYLLRSPGETTKFKEDLRRVLAEVGMWKG